MNPLLVYLSRRVTATTPLRVSSALGPLVSSLERGNVVDFRYADEDDEDDFTSNEEGSDSEPLGLVDNRNRVPTRKASRNKILPANARVSFPLPFRSDLKEDNKW